MKKGNCLIGALMIKATIPRVTIKWIPSWANGWKEILNHPWGHFFVCLSTGETIHFSSGGQQLEWYEQLWFTGYFKFKRNQK